VNRVPGCKPVHATHPGVRAVLLVLDGLPHAEVDGPPDDSGRYEPGVTGVLAEPRGRTHLALYWLDGGQFVRPDGQPHTVRLDEITDRLHQARWVVVNDTVRYPDGRPVVPNLRRAVLAWCPVAYQEPVAAVPARRPG